MVGVIDTDKMCIRDRILNVSTVTVSKALSDQKGVSEEMRDKIKQLAEEMGYQSPSEARRKKEHQSYNICLLYTS